MLSLLSESKTETEKQKQENYRINANK